MMYNYIKRHNEKKKKSSKEVQFSQGLIESQGHIVKNIINQARNPKFTIKAVPIQFFTGSIKILMRICKILPTSDFLDNGSSMLVSLIKRKSKKKFLPIFENPSIIQPGMHKSRQYLLTL